MIEIKKNLWDCDGPKALLCITTNGFVKNNGEAVMGRGCAQEAKRKWPELPESLGGMIKMLGNTVFIWDNDKTPGLEGQLATLPVKHNWWEDSDVQLIKASIIHLVKMVDTFSRDDLPEYTTFEKIYIPRPGCGNGKLDWETQVKPVIEPLLDDRFIIVDFPND